MHVDLYLRRPRGVFFASNHPWLALAVLVVLVAVVLYLNQRRR